MRARLAASICAHPRLELLGQYASGKAALADLENRVPNVLLVDLGLEDMSGLEVIRRINQRQPGCDILVVTMFGDEEHVLSALEAGARGYLLKGDDVRDIAMDIEEIGNGGSPLSPIIARQVLKRLRSPGTPAAPAGLAAAMDEGLLTDRESEILRTIARGFTYAETAELLHISKDTVHTHLKRVYRKLAVNSKTEAVFEAEARKLI